MQARYAAAIDDLSGGRLVLGMGAGWQAREHQRFGLPFFDFATRYQMLEEALQVIEAAAAKRRADQLPGTALPTGGCHPAAASGAPWRSTDFDRGQRS